MLGFPTLHRTGCASPARRIRRPTVVVLRRGVLLILTFRPMPRAVVGRRWAGPLLPALRYAEDFPNCASPCKYAKYPHVSIYSGLIPRWMTCGMAPCRGRSRFPARCISRCTLSRMLNASSWSFDCRARPSVWPAGVHAEAQKLQVQITAPAGSAAGHRKRQIHPTMKSSPTHGSPGMREARHFLKRGSSSIQRNIISSKNAVTDYFDSACLISTPQIMKRRPASPRHSEESILK